MKPFAAMRMRKPAAAVASAAVLEDVTQTAQATTSTTVGVTMPATVNVGDLLLVIVSARSAGAAATLTTPAGYVLLRSGTSGGTATPVAVYSKVAVGTEDGTTLNITASIACSAAAQVIRVRTGTFNPVIASAVFQTVTSSTTPDPPSCAATNPGEDTLWITGFGSNGSAAPSAYPSGYTDNQNVIASGGTLCRVITCTKTNTASPEDPGVFTMGASTHSVSFTLGVSPPPASSFYDIIMANTPTNYWRNGEASGAVMVDEIGADGAYTGSVGLGGAVLYPGGPTSIGPFTSSSNFGQSTNIPATMTAMTLISIIRPTNLSGFKLIGVQRDSNAGGRKWQWRSNGAAMEFVKIFGSTTTVAQAAMLAINTTYLIGFEVDAAGNYVMYRNGIAVKSGTLAAGNYGGAGDPFRVGFANGPSTGVQGQTCENAVFDHVLGPTVHAALAAAAGL